MIFSVHISFVLLFSEGAEVALKAGADDPNDGLAACPKVGAPNAGAGCAAPKAGAACAWPNAPPNEDA